MVVSTLFWALTLVGQHFLSKEDATSKKENFECGFENISVGENQLDFKNTVVLSFLIIYDIELLLLLPVSFNIFYISHSGAYELLLILITVVGTCLIDVESGTLEYDN